MDFNEAFSKLVRAGERNLVAQRIIHEAIDELAKTLAKYYPGDGETAVIFAGATFRHWPGGEYELKIDRGGWGVITLSKDTKTSDSVFKFSDLVRSGNLLGRISKRLDRETSILEQAAAHITNFNRKK